MTRAKKDILCSYADGATYSLMVGFGETYLSAFALAVGLSQVTSGLLGSLPLVAGGLLQMLAPAGARLLGSFRRWVVLCATLQGLVYVPLALAALRGSISTGVLFALAALYWGTGMAASPVWNNWIDAIIPGARLREFLAVRSRLTQLAAFLAFLAGGYLLTVWQGQGQVLTGFMLLFLLAGACRLVSAVCLAGQTDVRAEAKAERPLPLRQVLKRFREKGGGRFLLFLLVSQVSVNIAGPFFSPYMLAHVGFSYGEYVALVSGAYVSKILFYPYVARFVKRVGTYRALWMSGICVAPPPLFWFWTPQLYALITLQVFAGIAWAAFELASTLLVFDRIKAEERIRILTYYNLFNAVAVVVGSLIGGAVLESLPATEAYHTIFAASAAARLLSLGVLFGMTTMTVKARRLAFRVISLRPSTGTLSQPILTSGDESKDEPVKVS